jgi:beta-N-acetylglucosaminidase
MTDDLRNNTYENAINYEMPYYNYYQYISFRSKTNYTYEELNTYISNHTGVSSGIYNTGIDFINAQDSVYINAAMELAFAIHESGWGNSWIAVNKNNLFGINAVDSDPYNSATSFDTVQDCIEYHVQYFLGTRYFNPQYFVSYGTNFGNKYQGMNYKYASDAFWGEKIAKHYYNLDKELGFKDRNSYKIALLKPEALGYYGPNTAGPVVYNPATYTYRGLLIPFAVMKEKDDFYVLRLPLGLNENYVMDSNETMGPTDVFYVLKEDVIIVN